MLTALPSPVLRCTLAVAAFALGACIGGPEPIPCAVNPACASPHVSTSSLSAVTVSNESGLLLDSAEVRRCNETERLFAARLEAAETASWVLDGGCYDFFARDSAGDTNWMLVGRVIEPSTQATLRFLPGGKAALEQYAALRIPGG
ncbi:MAG: hypothetical protein HY275_12590 [Gemmatimonadetes bacterium]|nr:hypothetical protein [Gemmatimonadota bacterium]